jgi:DNA modification methylase
MNFKIMTGDNRDTLKTLADNSIDAIVTDPPYGIDFLGKTWDANTGAVETYQECLRVLKPGGHILAFSAARTYHHLAVTLEQAGFEIRDQIMWIYSSGFPKAQDIGKAIDKRAGKRVSATVDNTDNTYSVGIASKCSKCNMPHGTATRGLCKQDDCPINEALKPADNEWAGWKTALKPAHEPICMARKPFKGSTIDNVLAHGVGALNIDATRIVWDEKAQANIRRQNALGGEIVGGGIEKYATVGEDADGKHETQRILLNDQGRYPSNVIGEVEGYQKFFHCPKVSRKERHVGFDTDTVDSIKSMLEDMKGYYIDNNGNAVDYDERDGKSQVFLPHLGPIYIHGIKHEYALWKGENNNKGNNHPTVKPVELMKYLIKLITPPGGVVLDPFNGSGSTGMAAVELGHTYIGCELDPAYVDIATKRIQAWNTSETTGTTYEELFE